MNVKLIGLKNRSSMVCMTTTSVSIYIYAKYSFSIQLLMPRGNAGTHIFFVGDSAQCIYGFRGAKSKHVMKLDCIDTQLTTSWRFG